jgi:hypothetical protein
MSANDHTEGRRFRFWPRTFWMRFLLVVVILIVVANLMLLTAGVSSSGSLGIEETGGTGP